MTQYRRDWHATLLKAWLLTTNNIVKSLPHSLVLFAHGPSTSALMANLSVHVSKTGPVILGTRRCHTHHLQWSTVMLCNLTEGSCSIITTYTLWAMVHPAPALGLEGTHQMFIQKTKDLQEQKRHKKDGHNWTSTKCQKTIPSEFYINLDKEQISRYSF